MTDEEVRKLVEGILREKLGPLGFDHLAVRSDRDHDDEPALYLDAVFKAGSGPLQGDVSVSVLRLVSDALIERGETRFPYLTSRYPDDERSEDPDRHLSSAHS